MSRILFSPVGGTDPISKGNYHDGSLLQIARHYKPDIIYLYMSQEILKKHHQDNRFCYCIGKLGEHIGHSFEVRLIERPDLVDVQLFDPIYEDFDHVLEEITSSMDSSDELLLNISSGTPSMKSALLVLATMVDIPCKCIQVDTPERKMNSRNYDKEGELTIEEQWELNCDNDYQPGDANYDRTHEETLISLKKLKYEATIREFVSSYDYHSALLLAKEMKAEDAPYFKKLELADARQRMDFYKVNDLLKDQDASVYSPVRDDTRRTVYEYMLVLQAKVKQAEFADFSRAISPLIVDLYEEILKKHAGFKLSDYTMERDGMVKWDMEKLEASEKFENILKNAFNGGFYGGWVKSIHLVKLMEALISDEAILKCVKDLRTVEEKVRNTSAHNMVSVSDSWVKNNTGFTSEEIIGQLKKAFGYTSYNIKDSDWDSYDRMNEDILKAI